MTETKATETKAMLLASLRVQPVVDGESLRPITCFAGVLPLTCFAADVEECTFPCLARLLTPLDAKQRASLAEAVSKRVGIKVHISEPPLCARSYICADARSVADILLVLNATLAHASLTVEDGTSATFGVGETVTAAAIEKQLAAHVKACVRLRYVPKAAALTAAAVHRSAMWSTDEGKAVAAALRELSGAKDEFVGTAATVGEWIHERTRVKDAPPGGPSLP